jgi:pimeloyl-ACP methyl ester carboxylesterase
MWQPQLDALTEYHCLAPDLPEHGRSAAYAPFTLRGAADAVVALIRERTPAGRAHVVGLSIGAAVGLEMLCLAPQCIDRSVLSGTTPPLGKTLVTIVDAAIGPSLRLLPPRWLISSTMKQMKIPPEYFHLVNADFELLTPALYRHINRATGEVRLPQTPAPGTLVVVGEHEPTMSRRHAANIGNRVQGASAFLVGGVGHAWSLQAPELFNATVRAWLTGAQLPAALAPLDRAAR